MEHSSGVRGRALSTRRGLRQESPHNWVAVLFPCLPAFTKRRFNTRSPSTNQTRRLEKPPPKSSNTVQGSPGPPSSAEATSYREVRKDITKYVGKRVAWVGKYVSSSNMSTTVNGKRSDSTQEYRYALVDEDGSAVLEDSFCFSHPGTKKDTKRTPAAQAADNNPRDNGIRLIRGTIAGSKTIRIPGSGKDRRAIEVPDLKDVVIAMPPKGKRQ